MTGYLNRFVATFSSANSTLKTIITMGIGKVKICKFDIDAIACAVEMLHSQNIAFKFNYKNLNQAQTNAVQEVIQKITHKPEIALVQKGQMKTKIHRTRNQ